MGDKAPVSPWGPDYAVVAPTLKELYDSKETIVCQTMDQCAELVKNGSVDAAYMPNATARYYSRSDAQNRLGYSIVNGHTRNYVISVASEQDFLLVETLSRSIGSLSTEYVSGEVPRARISKSEPVSSAWFMTIPGLSSSFRCF